MTGQIGYEIARILRRIRLHESLRGGRFLRFRSTSATRIRKNYTTRTEAQAERQTLEIARIQAEFGGRTAATRLTDDQLKEAEAAFHRLEGRTRSLAFYLEYPTRS